MMEFSQIRSEDYVEEEKARNFKERTIMKYRLYGRDSLTNHEWDKIIHWGIAPKKYDEYGKPVVQRQRVKKKVLKRKISAITGEMQEIESDASGNDDSAFMFKESFEYVDNE